VNWKNLLVGQICWV